MERLKTKRNEDNLKKTVGEEKMRIEIKEYIFMT